jgi:SAM-dependent methyltransferase
VNRNDWDRRYAEGQMWSTGPNARFAEEVAGLGLPPGRALDLGCGEGRNALWLAQKGWDAVGVDFSTVAIERARERARTEGLEARCTFVVADVLEYVPAAGAFDLAAAIYLQLVASERARVLRAAASAVAPGGALVVIAHHSDNLTDGVGGPQDPSVLYTEFDVVDDLAGALDVVTAERVLRRVDDRDAIDVLVVARAW